MHALIAARSLWRGRHQRYVTGPRCVFRRQGPERENPFSVRRFRQAFSSWSVGLFGTDRPGYAKPATCTRMTLHPAASLPRADVVRGEARAEACTEGHAAD